MTAAERFEFDALATAYGITAAELVRHRVLGWRMTPTAVEARTRSLHITALVRLGTNLNQIAYHLNAGHPASEDLHALVKRIDAEMDHLLDEDD